LNNCENCDWSGTIGSSLACIKCQDGFTPVKGGCARANCDKFDEENKDQCSACKKDYYMVFDDTRCVQECPVDTISVDGAIKWCAPVCENGSYVNLTEPLSGCEPCEGEVESCVLCHYDSEVPAVVCDECVVDLYPAWRGDLCSPCTFDQYEEADGSCRYCNEKMPNCYLCTVNGPLLETDWVCDACFGEVPPILKDDEDVIEACECDIVQYIKINDDEDPDSLTCESCLRKIPNCNTCEQEISWDGETVEDVELVCTQCRNGYWIDENGLCVPNSC